MFKSGSDNLEIPQILKTYSAVKPNFEKQISETKEKANTMNMHTKI